MVSSLRAHGRHHRRWPMGTYRLGAAPGRCSGRDNHPYRGTCAAASGQLRRRPMASDPKIRASDADRDRTAALLREHLAAGRLSSEEFNERLDKAYAAKTLGELDQLLADLPGIDLYHLPDHSVERR